MDWTQVLFSFLANTSLILWMRSESRSDWRHMDSKLDACNNKLDVWMRESREEMRDFHGKLISIEERRRKWGE
jgi:hypothetical protein